MTMHMEKTRLNNRAVIYVRSSSMNEHNSLTSAVNQEEKCREFAAKHGYEVDWVFTDTGSAMRGKENPQLRELIAYCGNKQNHISAVIVIGTDRLARSLVDYMAVRSCLREFGVDVLSTTESLDDSPSGQFMEAVMGYFSQYESSVRSLRAKRAWVAKKTR